ncbi:MAG: LmeA family phospholipid-binding protein [Nocardiopsaceae bacterium]|nr:LmeA family phospholipid-binding protein [Nocardiopsaceae bacterium]
MSGYPNQPRSSRGGWPEQPPPYSPGQQGYQGGPGYRDPGYSGPGYSGPGYQRGSRAGGYPPRPASVPRRKRRGRKWIALLITLAVLAVAFVVGDQIARTYAQNMIASKVESAGFPVKPSVSIKGWPFLTQVLMRDVGQVDLSASNVREGKLDIASINATARGVHISSGYNSATISTTTGTGLITFRSLLAATGASGVTLSADPSAGPNSVKMTVQVSGLGTATGAATITRTSPTSLAIRADDLNGIPASSLGSLADYTINLPHLPAGMELSGVSVQGQGVSIQITAHNTTLGGG